MDFVNPYFWNRQNKGSKICSETGIAHDTKIGSLDEADLEKLRKAVAEYEVEGDLRRDISTNIKRLMDLGTNRGIRHRKRLPVRGPKNQNKCKNKKRTKKPIRR